MRFSERYGYKETRSIAQVEAIDDSLRTGLWNVTFNKFMCNSAVYYDDEGESMFRVLWAVHFEKDLSALPDDRAHAAQILRSWFLKAQWYEVYDLIQEIVHITEDDDLEAVYNRQLERYLAGYRFVDGEVTPLTEKTEVEEVQNAIDGSTKHPGVRHHLRTALTLYSDLENPDYANSVKESISAVESLVKSITGKGPLGPGLDELRRMRPDMHAALAAGWKSIYGYASDAPAIRHGGDGAPSVDQALARYFLVSCSAFCNYLMAES